MTLQASCSAESGLRAATANVEAGRTSSALMPGGGSLDRWYVRLSASSRKNDFDVAARRHELAGQHVEQLRVRRRVLAVMQVERVHQSPAHHERPEAVDDVAVELGRGPRRSAASPGAARRL